MVELVEAQILKNAALLVGLYYKIKDNSKLLVGLYYKITNNSKLNLMTSFLNEKNQCNIMLQLYFFI